MATDTLTQPNEVELAEAGHAEAAARLAEVRRIVAEADTAHVALEAELKDLSAQSVKAKVARLLDGKAGGGATKGDGERAAIRERIEDSTAVRAELCERLAEAGEVERAAHLRLVQAQRAHLAEKLLPAANAELARAQADLKAANEVIAGLEQRLFGLESQAAELGRKVRT